MEEERAPDIVMFVGSQFYPIAEDYITESLSLGCSKRISRPPKELVPGKSRCFLAHDDGKIGQGFIFGFFVISGFEIILDDEEKIRKYQEEYEKLNIQPVSVAEAAAEPVRRCGHRVTGAMYVISRPEMDKAWEIADDLYSKADIGGGLVILLHRIAYPRRRFRGWRYMEPEFLEKYGWPQRLLPVKRSVKFEKKEKVPIRKHQKPLFEVGK